MWVSFWQQTQWVGTCRCTVNVPAGPRSVNFSLWSNRHRTLKPILTPARLWLVCKTRVLTGILCYIINNLTVHCGHSLPLPHFKYTFSRSVVQDFENFGFWVSQSLAWPVAFLCNSTGFSSTFSGPLLGLVRFFSFLLFFAYHFVTPGYFSWKFQSHHSVWTQKYLSMWT